MRRFDLLLRVLRKRLDWSLSVNISTGDEVSDVREIVGYTCTTNAPKKYGWEGRKTPKRSLDIQKAIAAHDKKFEHTSRSHNEMCYMRYLFKTSSTRERHPTQIVISIFSTLFVIFPSCDNMHDSGGCTSNQTRSTQLPRLQSSKISIHACTVSHSWRRCSPIGAS
ncbi:hypothetical protein VTI28DRAFT_6893 [Corynascus sepedonium]